MFFGFLRAGEVVVPSDPTFDPTTRLAYGDVRVDDVVKPQYLEVGIKASKDRLLTTRVFHVPRSHKEGGMSSCLNTGLHSLAGSLPRPLLPVSAREIPHKGPVHHSSARGLGAGRDQFLFLRQPNFHIGAATTAAQRGIPDSLIKTLGRWQSAAYTTYIHTPQSTLCSVSRSLVHPSPDT